MKYGILEGLSLLKKFFFHFCKPTHLLKMAIFGRCQKIANIQIFGMSPVLPLETSYLHRNLV